MFFTMPSNMDLKEKSILVQKPVIPPDENFITESLEFMCNLNEEINNVFLDLFAAFNISSTYNEIDILTEGMNDFISGIKDVIKKLIKFIELFFERFKRYLLKFANNDSFIKKAKDKLSTVSFPKDLKYKGFRYTIIENIPNVSCLESLKHELNDEDYIDIGSKIKKLKDELTSHYYFNNIYTNILNSSAHIGKDKFKDELYKTFRRGEKEEKDIYITTEVVNEFITSLENYKKNIKDVAESKDKIISLYKSLERYFDSSLKIKYINRNSVSIEISKFKIENDKLHSTEVEKREIKEEDARTLASYMQLRGKQVKEIGVILNIAFAEKLEAIIEEKKKAREVLHIVLMKDKNII